MVLSPLEKHENNVIHLWNSPSMNLRFKRLWLKTMHLPIDYHVRTKEKYVTSNELSLIPILHPVIIYTIKHSYPCVTPILISSKCWSTLLWNIREVITGWERTFACQVQNTGTHRWDFIPIIIWYWGSCTPLMCGAFIHY